MSQIRKLDEETIALIAAGEVVESPASVVKELVENSLDAGATEITVEIACGGQELIRVIDNGCGMDREDASLSLHRHTTSKFVSLERIRTMGFRGEALAAISSVSYVRVLTNNSSNEAGATLVIDGAAHPSIRPQGTTVEVHSLFYNTPARRKFQKTPSGDQQAIVRMMEALSLVNPTVHFSLISEKQKQLFPSTSLSSRFAQVTECKEWFAIDTAKEDLQMQGVVGAPSYTRATRSGQYWSINGRFVLCPTLSQAVQQGFSTLLDAKRYPLFVLHLTLPPDAVDVNVHPQKSEVRLSNERELFPFIARAISKALIKPIEITPWEKELSFAPHPAVAPLEIRRSEQRELFGTTFIPIIGTWGPYVLLDRAVLPREFPLGKGIVFVHKRKARTLLLQEQLLKPQSIDLATPFIVDITESEGMLLEQSDLDSLGFRIQLLGPTRCLVEAMPLEGTALSFRALIDELKGKKPLTKAVALAFSSDPTPAALWLGHFFALPNAHQCCTLYNPDET